MNEKSFSRFSAGGAQNYENYLGPFVFEPFAKYTAEHIDYAGAKDLLEIAAGTGRVTRHIKKMTQPSAHLTALDNSADMLKVAREVLKDDSIQFVVADAQELPFPDESFDTVVCQFGIMFMPDKDKAMNEMYRVLRKGGRVYYTTWESIDNTPFLDLLYNKHITPFYRKFGAEQGNTSFYLPFLMNDKVALNDYMKKAKFGDTTVNEVKLTCIAPSPEYLTTGYILNHPMGKHMAEFYPDAPKRIAEQLNKEIAAKFGTGPVQCEMTALLCAGRKEK